MSNDRELRKLQSYRTRSWFSIVYGAPFGLGLIALVWLASYWLAIPMWLIGLLLAIQLAAVLIDIINVVALKAQMGRLQREKRQD